MTSPTCPNCGYDTAGLPVSRCPECGQVIPQTTPAAPGRAQRFCLAGATIAATIAVGYGMTGPPGVPRPWGVLPLTVIIPLFMSESMLVALIPLTILATVLTIPTLLAARNIRLRSAVPVLGAMALSWYCLSAGIPYGTKYESIGYVVFCILMNGAITAALLSLWLVNRSRPRFAVAVAFHALVSLWLASYAFPYMGELP